MSAVEMDRQNTGPPPQVMQNMHWHAMTDADLPAVTAMAAVLHPDHFEDDAVFAERLRLYPPGCQVLRAGAQEAGYVISHPWRIGSPPPLNEMIGALPSRPDTFHLHDLAVLPPARGFGAAGRVIGKLAQRAEAEDCLFLSLVAVGGSETFWRAHGFAPAEQPPEVRSYGDGAVYMVRAVRKALRP